MIRHIAYVRQWERKHGIDNGMIDCLLTDSHYHPLLGRFLAGKNIALVVPPGAKRFYHEQLPVERDIRRRHQKMTARIL